MPEQSVQQKKLRKCLYFFACGLGSGLVPKAPGTCGTVLAVVFWWFLWAKLTWPYYLVMLMLTSLLGIYICAQGALHLDEHDHPSIVWDEFCGYWITMFLAPPNIWYGLYGFLWFRIFDIWKPGPIGWLDRNITGGMGIMLDDIAAGLFAFIVLQITLFFGVF